MSKSRPAVSVIITTRNRARMLEECLLSVFAQTFTGFEVIVVDDASDDETPALLSRHRARARSIRLGSRSGSAAGRNVAVEAAAGEFVAFLDDDDLWAPHKLEKQVPAFVDGSLQLLHSDFDAVDAAGALLCRNVMTCPPRSLGAVLSPRQRWIVDAYRRCPVALLRPMPQISTCIMRTEALRRVGPFDLEFPRVYYDLDMWLRFQAEYGPGGTRFMKESLTSYRIHPRQILDVVSTMFGKERRRRPQVSEPEQFDVLIENLLFGVRFSREHYYCREDRHVCAELPAPFKIPTARLRGLLRGSPAP